MTVEQAQASSIEIDKMRSRLKQAAVVREYAIRHFFLARVAFGLKGKSLAAHNKTSEHFLIKQEAAESDGSAQ